MNDLLSIDVCAVPTAVRPLRLAGWPISDDLFASVVRGVEEADGEVRRYLKATRDLA